MELINNTTKTLKDDLSVEIKQGSKVSIAAACFSIYAFQELKAQLSQIDELRFIFTSPTFVTEKAKKEKRMDVQSCGDSVHEINTLTVVASESYKTFVADLQSDIKTVLYDRPTVATSEYFKGKYVKR